MTLLETAIGIARTAHKSQRRISGEPYVEHPLAVLNILRQATQNLPWEVYVAAVLHDVLEETEDLEEMKVWLQAIQRIFGPDVTAMVQALTKDNAHYSFPPEIREHRYLDKLARCAEKHPGVLFIKMADRIHNLQTLGSLSINRRLHTIFETRELYMTFFTRNCYLVPKNLQRGYQTLIVEMQAFSSKTMINS